MIELNEARQQATRAALVAVQYDDQSQAQCEELLDELAQLADTAGIDTVARHVVRIDRPQPRFYIGSGNAHTIAGDCKQNDIDIIIFDDSLSPSQQQNWEKIADRPVIDRQELILDIFGQRATTREAELQIDLAKAEYMLPRLKGAWTHLHRQQGGVGVRGGEGEKQIEVDARLVRRRIGKLKDELTVVRRRRAEQRKRRCEIPVPNAAIVGYTNAGKSSLLNRLTAASVMVEDKLFATLDPTTRRIRLPNNQVLLLTDTVGFVRKLPHGLVEAFKATLEEAVLGEFLIHVADASSPSVEEHLRVTEQVLAEIGAAGKHVITVFNKTDLVDDPHRLRRLRRQHPGAICMSLRRNEGVDELVARMQQILDSRLEATCLRIPQDRYGLVAELHRTSHVHTESYEADGIYVSASVPRNQQRSFAEYVVDAAG